MAGGIIPTYESKENIDQMNLPRESGQAIARSESAQNNMINAVSTAEDVAVKIRNTQQINAANAVVAEQLTALRDQAERDNDLHAQPRYEKQIDDLGNEIGKTIQGQMARDDFSTRYRIAAASTKSTIGDIFRKKQLDAAQADFFTSMEAYKTSYLAATYPNDKVQILQDIRRNIENNVANQVISREDGAKTWDKISKDIPVGEAERDIGVNPTLALQRLQANEYGIKDEDKRASLIADAERSAIRRKKMEDLGLEQAQEKLAVDLTQKLWNGTLTLTDIRDELSTGMLDRKDAEHLRNALVSERTADLKNSNAQMKEETENEQAATYMEMWDMILRKGKASDKRRRILKEFADGKLNRKDAEKLYTGYLIPVQGGGKTSLAEEAAAEEASARKNKFIAGAIQLFRKMFNADTSAYSDGEVE